MAMMFSGEKASDVWNLAKEQLMKVDHTVASRSGDAYELLHVLLSIGNPKEKWVFNRVPAMSIALALAELIWILSGSDVAKIINYWNPNLDRYAGKDDHYHGAYGYRIRHNFGVDQLEKAYLVLKNNPESRQTVMLIWDPKKDLPQDNGTPNSEDIPCNICSMLKVRSNKLEWTQIMRSNDVFLGLPYNFIQFTSMQEILAGWLDLEVGTYNHYSDSLHLYKKNYNSMGTCFERYHKNVDSLSISKKSFDIIIKEIYQRMNVIVSTDVDEACLEKLSNLSSQEQAYNNIMFIITAYAARKKGFFLLKDKIINCCTNPLYREIWKKWEKNPGSGVEYHE
jgi:Thymidylate synthase